MGAGSYSIEDLERLLGVKARTIHYWAQEGLFEGPGAGRGARYTDEHLAKLFLIQKLRAEDRPIAEIKAALKRVRPAALRAWAVQAKAAPPRDATKAKQLITQWLQQSSEPDALAAGHRVRERLFSQRSAHESTGAGSVPAGHWERIPLASDVELHVRHPVSRTSHELVDALVALARRLSQENTR